MKKSIKFLALALLSISSVSCYDFDREQAEKYAVSEGKQILFKSESSKKAKIEEAKAKSIKIISNAIKENPEYLKYQLIESMKGIKNKVYIPTEAGLPIIERR